MLKSHYKAKAFFAIICTQCAFAAISEAADALHLTVTNSVIQESAVRLQNWVTIEASPCPTGTINVAISLSDSSELWITNAITLTTNICSVRLDLHPVWDTIVDGRQRVSITASAPGYLSASNNIDVTHVGGAQRQVEFKVDDRLSLFTETQNFGALQGPTKDNFSACLLIEQNQEIYILLNRTIEGLPGNPPSIQVYGTNGVYRRRILLHNFDDAEGICIVDETSNLFAIVEEGAVDRITLINITTNDASVNRNTGQSYIVPLPAPKVINQGLEGIIYDPFNENFFVVQEKSPMGVYRILLEQSNAVLDVLFDAEQVFDGLATDLSDISMDPVTGNLLILSDESQRLFECTLDGRILSMIDIPATQPEGVFLTADRRQIYVTSEPNELYRYDLQNPQLDVDEGTNINLSIGLSYPADTPVLVSLGAMDITAQIGLDYLLPTNQILFGANQVCTNFVVTILADSNDVELVEDFMVSIDSVSSNAVLQSTNTHLINILSQSLPLTVLSQYGTPDPAAGTTGQLFGEPINLRVPDSPVNVAGVTQLVCTGWIGTGSVPPIGAGPETGSFLFTNASTITWLWSTNVWLGVTINGGGQINGANEWLALGSTGTLAVAGSPYVVFDGWTGDVMFGEETNTVLQLVMQRAKHLSAFFTQLTTSNGIPYAWIDQYYSLTNDLDLLELADTDQDSMTTLQEYTANTSPLVDTDLLEIHELRRPQSQPYFQVRFKTKTGRRYNVYRSQGISATNTTLPIALSVFGNGGTRTVSDFQPLVSNAVYWLQVFIP
jgi:hypothetical protein